MGHDRTDQGPAHAPVGRCRVRSDPLRDVRGRPAPILELAQVVHGGGADVRRDESWRHSADAVPGRFIDVARVRLRRTRRQPRLARERRVPLPAGASSRARLAAAARVRPHPGRLVR